MNGLEDNRAELFGGINRTELYQLCRNSGIDVHPGTPRDLLILFLLGDESPDEYTVTGNPIDSWREGLINFISEYWQTIRPQIRCPAMYLKTPNEKTGEYDPRPCFKCTDMQVVTCIVQNPASEVFVDNLRKSKI